MPSQTCQPQTFHLFSELPTELQMQIWEYAAEVEDTEWLRLETIDAIHDRVEFREDWPDYVPATQSRRPVHDLERCSPTFFPALAKQSAVHGYHTRDALLQTCRLARLFALKAWRADVENIGACGMKYLLSDFIEHCTVTDREMKQAIGTTVNRLLEEVRARLL